MESFLRVWEKLMDLIAKAFPAVAGYKIAQLQSENKLNEQTTKEVKASNEAAANVRNATPDERVQLRNKWATRTSAKQSLSSTGK